jgi:hypothetical protein
MDTINQQKIVFNRERNVLQLLNDSMRFTGKNFKPLFQSIYCIIIPFTIIVTVFIFLPDRLRSSPFLYDLIIVIYKINSSLGFNPLMLITVGYLEGVVIYYYILIYNSNKAGEVITYLNVIKKVKDNALSLFSVLIVLLFGFTCTLLALIYLDTDITDMFGFSLFYILAFFWPFLCYFLFSALFIGILENLNLINAAQRVRSYFKNFGSIWINTSVVMVGLIILQKTVTSTFAALYTFVPVQFFIKVFPVTNVIEQLVTAGIIAIFVIICAFSYMSQEEKVKGKRLVSRIDEIK